MRQRGLLRNSISLIGGAIVVISLANIIFLFLVDLSEERPRPYLGIFYIILPGITVIGLLIALAGMIRERRRRRRLAPEEIAPYPSIDLNNPRHRRLFGVVATFTFAFLLLSSFGSYRAYELTGSVTFCGQACHQVMEPEFTAYQISPHARVGCTECHVGPGAPSFIRSKLSGVRRAWGAITDTHSRPIPSPVHTLRPAGETCGQCHWPEKFFGNQLKTITHFAYDEENTPRQTRLLMKIGGGGPTLGLTMGIHWHMNLANEIDYISTDDKHEVIPWVRLKNAEGRVTEYVVQDSPLTQEEIDRAFKRRMDCMDCHNRSAHTFLSPDRAVDDALLAGRLDRSLPYIKQQAVDVLTKSYSTTGEAMDTIAATIDEYYRTNYGEAHAARQDLIRSAINEVQSIYRRNFFPYMRVSWQTYPDHIGHYYSAGCFRCHDGQHVSKEGKVIRKDCAICHTVLDQTEGAAPIMAGNGRQFQHSIDLGDLTQVSCVDCHAGGGASQ
jgi:hypothetical protein